MQWSFTYLKKYYFTIQCISFLISSIWFSGRNCNHGCVYRPQLFGHRQALSAQLTVCEDPALVLHLTCLLLFQAVTQTMLQASGRFVSSILQFLTPHLTQDVNDQLLKYHGKYCIRRKLFIETCNLKCSILTTTYVWK